MSTIHVGCAGFQGPASKYWADLDLKELPENTLERVKLNTLSRWGRETPAGRKYVLPADRALVSNSFSGPEAEAAWARTTEAAGRLGAGVIMIHTPGGFRPSAESRAAFSEFFAGPGAQRPEGCRVAWRAEGLWEGQPEVQRALCDAAQVIPVVDPLALDTEELLVLDPGQGPFYWRLLGRAGLGARLSDYDLDALLEMVDEREDGFIMFGAITMLRQAKRFRAFQGPLGEVDTSDEVDEEHEEA
ncbi:MAG: hypothetical protein ACE366_27670 [Bradymonadia bacterium]